MLSVLFIKINKPLSVSWTLQKQQFVKQFRDGGEGSDGIMIELWKLKKHPDVLKGYSTGSVDTEVLFKTET